MISIEQIKKLRNDTGHSIAKCKEALEESSGDDERAREILREKGALTAQKKSDRNLGASVIQAYVHNTNKIGSMVEVQCETDFVAKNEEFIGLAKDIALHCVAFQPQYLKREDIPEDKMKIVMSELEELVDKDKPEDIKEKILQGKLDSKMKDVILLEQAFLKDDKITIQEVINEATQKFGERIEISKFTVFGV